MKTLLVSAALVCASGAAHGAPYRLTELRQQYLDGLFRAKPHLATFMGDHRFDEKLVDLGAEALKQREAELAALQKKLDALKPSLASTDEKVDGEILSDAIGLELLYLREIRDWEWDPRLYDSFPYYDPREIVAGRISDIMHGDFAPEKERRASVIGQLEALPRFLAEEQAAIERGQKRPSKEYLDA